MPHADRHFRLSVHATADVAAHEQWWADRLGLDLASFRLATLKRHRPKTLRRNCGGDYHGCLVVDVARSSTLYYSIEGWWRALVGSVSGAA